MIDLTPFAALPDTARLWAYGADRPLSDAEQAQLLARLNGFPGGWRSHGRPVEGRAVVAADRFLLVAGIIQAGDISGCGIDACVHAVEEAGRLLGIDWVPALNVFYRDGDGQIRAATRADFRSRVREGGVTAETPVFDLSIGTLGELRQGRFERRAADTWHARVFRIPQAA